MALGARLVMSVVLALLLPANAAWAASTVDLKHASDGTLLVVGEGWRPGALVVTLGQDRFTAQVDSAGDFEVATGLTLGRGPLALHHVQGTEMPMLALESSPSPLSVALVEGLADGLRDFLTSGLVATVLIATRQLIKKRRYPQH